MNDCKLCKYYDKLRNICVDPDVFFDKEGYVACRYNPDAVASNKYFGEKPNESS